MGNQILNKKSIIKSTTSNNGQIGTSKNDEKDKIKSDIQAIGNTDVNQMDSKSLANHMGNKSPVSNTTINMKRRKAISIMTNIIINITEELEVQEPINDKVHPMDIKIIMPANNSILQLKTKITEGSGVPIDEQVLMHKGRILTNDMTIRDCGPRFDIENGHWYLDVTTTDTDLINFYDGNKVV